MMKVFPLMTMMILLAGGCTNTSSKSATGVPAQIEFKETTYDFGTIPFGSDGTCNFEFQNTSGVPLIISMVKTSCGCTSPEWPKDLFDPGKEGIIKIKYNTNIRGVFRKSITVYTNAKNSPEMLFIKGEVSPEKSSEKN